MQTKSSSESTAPVTPHPFLRFRIVYYDNHDSNSAGRNRKIEDSHTSRHLWAKYVRHLCNDLYTCHSSPIPKVDLEQKFKVNLQLFSHASSYWPIHSISVKFTILDCWRAFTMILQQNPGSLGNLGDYACPQGLWITRSFMLWEIMLVIAMSSRKSVIQ